MLQYRFNFGEETHLKRLGAFFAAGLGAAVTSNSPPYKSLIGYNDYPRAIEDGCSIKTWESLQRYSKHHRRS